MKKTLKTLSTILLATSSIFLGACNKDENMNEPYIETKITNLDALNTSEIHYLGRYTTKEIEGEEAIYFGFTNTGFELFVDVKNEINSISASLFSEMLGGNTNQYLKTYIDGKEERKIELGSGKADVTLFSNLEIGRHTLKVVKINEASVSKLGVYSLSYNGEIDFYDRDYKEAPKLIEFYGDSLTCGYGNLGDPSIKIFRTMDEDGTLTYAQLTADKLGYESSVVACSGIALSEVLAPYGVDMMDQYNTVEGSIPYDMSKSKPDIVVFNLGSNDDGGYESLSEEKRKEGIEEFINNYAIITDEIKKNSPECVFISCYNMCYNINNTLINAIKTATENINNKYGENTAFSLAFQGNQSGANGHPNLIGHKIAFDRLYNFIIDNNLNK